MKRIVIALIGIILVLVVLKIVKEKKIGQENFDSRVSKQQKVYKAKNQKIKSIKFIVENGARPRFSPDGKYFLFDRKNKDGYYDLYISDLRGAIVTNLTEERTGINQLRGHCTTSNDCIHGKIQEQHLLRPFQRQ